MLLPSDGDDAILAASSGRGHRCIGASALLAFSDQLNAHGAWIDIVETFEVAEGWEIPRIDLSIYGDHGSYDLPAADRKALAARRLSEMMATVAKEVSALGFDVWLDRDD
ncbi:hypothetical protein [Brevundimonas sp.]|uniref:hypothetical protein n=1 Tax=Brevundimonas sp. TaxID=1871086 RepID=UPI001A343A82|nr:hypothetical protein [Brevundimonas sp.]MBJ7484275.1 hypothetical protein [Brevundimonas sp.]